MIKVISMNVKGETNLRVAESYTEDDFYSEIGALRNRNPSIGWVKATDLSDDRDIYINLASAQPERYDIPEFMR